ncbi:unnamed protein product [Merluccius merluccius]
MEDTIVYSEPVRPPPHTFYFGIHPVSWFTLISNISIGFTEWYYLLANFCRPKEKKKEESEEKYSMEDTIDFSEPVRPPAHTFYFGIHPVSWFILISNISIGFTEWYYLLTNFWRLKEKKKEESEETVRVEVEEDDDDDNDD